MSELKGLVKGDICNRDGCKGYIEEVDDDSSCSCHICPPCSHCVDMEHYCSECDYQSIDDEPEQTKVKSSGYASNFGQKRKSFDDLDNSKIDYLVITGAYYSMVYHGVFPKGTTREDIAKLFNTCFGCKWLGFDEDNQTFKLKVYTD